MIKKLVLATCVMSTMTSCSVYQAVNQPSKKDLSVLNVGTPRALVIAELGEPIHSEGPKMAQKDIFSFVQGYSTANKASRATLHTVGDILTLGLWEVVGTPAEMIADGSDVRAEVLYDKNVKVKKVTPYKGHNLIKNIDKN